MVAMMHHYSGPSNDVHGYPGPKQTRIFGGGGGDDADCHHRQPHNLYVAFYLTNHHTSSLHYSVSHQPHQYVILAFLSYENHPNH